MAGKFEEKLIAASSESGFKAAKKLLKNNKCLGCFRDNVNVLHALFEDNQRYETVAVSTGAGENSCQCSCTGTQGKLCPHAVAAILYMLRFTEPPGAKNDPVLFGGIKYMDFFDWAVKNHQHPNMYGETAQLYIDAQREFPHAPSKWENSVFKVKLVMGKRQYMGNQANLRQLYFDGNLSAVIKLKNFSPQARQIIRFLAINAEAESSNLLLNSEKTAAFFHCLGGFENFQLDNRRVIIHRQTAGAVLLCDRKEKKQSVVLQSALKINDLLLPLKKARVIAGQSGCWSGTGGEYWWVPAQIEVPQLRAFLRAEEQQLNETEAKEIIAEVASSGIEIIDSKIKNVPARTCTAAYSAKFDDEILKLNISFDYGHGLMPADRRALCESGNSFIRRNQKYEDRCVRELLQCSFVKERSSYVQHSAQSLAFFINEVIPRWQREGRDFFLDSTLTALCRDNSCSFECKVADTGKNIFTLDCRLFDSRHRQLDWAMVINGIEKNSNYLFCNGRFIHLTNDMRNFLLGVSSVMKEKSENLFELPVCALPYYLRNAKNIPNAIPGEFSGFENLAPEKILHENITPETESKFFTGSLRPYQTQGVNWLKKMHAMNYNIILADEMGLGKTIQTLALLAGNHLQCSKPSMIICPASLVDNWKRECERFTPKLKVMAVNGSDRADLWKNIKKSEYDLYILSYTVARIDSSKIVKCHFDTLILDEAQHIKNRSSANAKNCKSIKADHKLVLTGTPLENSTDDLWSIFDFLHPGLLGGFKTFQKRYANIGNDRFLQQDLANKVTAFILRRTKAEVCRELPPKIEQNIFCEMPQSQRAFYEEVFHSGREQFLQLRKQKGSKLEILTILLRLRQICCDPRLLPAGQFTVPEKVESAKLNLICELIDQNFDSGCKTLIFSQFTSFLALIRERLEEKNLNYEYLDGATRKRMERVDSFNNNKNIPFFLLSLKAGGVGLNLTGADNVIICDPWWNPATESQAADRTHRIGQKKTVNVFRLTVKDSIEEKILSLQKSKQKIFDALIENPAKIKSRLTAEEMDFLFSE